MSATYDDFKKLDIRVANILKAEKILGKTKIIKGTIDLGKETRSVIIGGAEFYEPEDLVGKTVVVIANLETKKRPVSVVADNIEVRNIKRVQIKINNLIRFKLLYDRNSNLTKKIKLEQIKKKTIHAHS